MIIRSNCVDLGMDMTLIEPKICRDASNYMVENYSEIVKKIENMGIKEKANDLLHDMFISMVEAEDNGEGFDMEYGIKNSENGTVMDVAQFVYGRAKLYAKNTKYRNDVIERGKFRVLEVNTYYETEMDDKGRVVIGKDGKPKLNKVTTKTKNTLCASTYAASFDQGGDKMEGNDEFQKAFSVACLTDTVDDITEILSLKEQIDFCIDICDNNDIAIINVFKNIDYLAKMVADVNKRKKAAESVFNKITELVNYHDEFAESLRSVLLFSGNNRNAFDAVMSAY
jgi:hypothetical protein